MNNLKNKTFFSTTNGDVNKTDDIYTLFAYKVWKVLKNKCNASVFVINDNDILVIKITKGPFSFKHLIPQIGPKLLEGLTVDSVVREILDLYKTEVLKWFFNKHE